MKIGLKSKNHKHSDLTKQKITTIDIPTDKKGTYNFACGMDMFHGKVVVK